ncbi:hypothetical protein [Brevundimonas sp.]|uniref:hypothetical protein n=1 Tax=Brevundimonas sp. TaxID=1871086 RepID=UPI002635C626|nr:hypothetical protein [Brevundimonas sp.]
MNRDGWRVLIKGLSVVAGIAAFGASLVWVVFAKVLEGYATNAAAAWLIAAVFALAGAALCAWPWLQWKPPPKA